MVEPLIHIAGQTNVARKRPSCDNKGRQTPQNDDDNKGRFSSEELVDK